MQRVAGREHLNGTTDGDFGVAAQRRLLQTKARCDAAKSAVVRALGEKKPLSFPPPSPSVWRSSHGPAGAPAPGIIRHIHDAWRTSLRFMARLASVETSSQTLFLALTLWGNLYWERIPPMRATVSTM